MEPLSIAFLAGMMCFLSFLIGLYLYYWKIKTKKGITNIVEKGFIFSGNEDYKENNENNSDEEENLKENLKDYFCEGIKIRPKKNIGIEIEHFILRKDTGKAVSFSEEKGVLYILKQHILCYPNAKPITEGNILFGFKTKDFSITLELYLCLL